MVVGCTLSLHIDHLGLGLDQYLGLGCCDHNLGGRRRYLCNGNDLLLWCNDDFWSDGRNGLIRLAMAVGGNGGDLVATKTKGCLC